MTDHNSNVCWKSRSDLVAKNPLHQSHSGEHQTPIVYNKIYNISAYGVEKLHVFDTRKWGRIADYLLDYFKRKNSRATFVSPTREIEREELRLVHTDQFLHDLENSKIFIAKGAEVAILAVTPWPIIRESLLKPIKFQASGSILAGFMALKYGWSIHLGGGFHHCSSSKAGGFCLLADITLLIKYLWKEIDQNLKVLIVDLDAHQGNGHEEDAIKMKNENPDVKELLSILDMYNCQIYPHEPSAVKGIDYRVRLQSGTGDNEYIQKLQLYLHESLENFKPDLIVYNAGTDILRGDPLGQMNISPEGIIKRDELVFSSAKSRGINVVMLTSGGYQNSNARIIADSIVNLFEKKIIELPGSCDSLVFERPKLKLKPRPKKCSQS